VKKNMSNPSSFAFSSFGTSDQQLESWQQQDDQTSWNGMPRNIHDAPPAMDHSGFYQNGSSHANMGMHSKMGLDFDLRSDRKDDANGEGAFVSHFPGPPIQTNKACQQGPGIRLKISHIYFNMK
jgi:hypothetical protein